MDKLTIFNAGVAFAFGFLSFLSPCVLPLLPGYLFYIAGREAGDGQPVYRSRVVRNSIVFVLAFSLLFMAMGAAASGIGQWLNQHREPLTRAAGAVMIIFGLHVSEVLPLKVLYRQARWLPTRHFSGWPGAFIMGLSFAAAWTPCVGPVLASILLLAGRTETVGQGMALLGFYSLGLAVPFVLAAAGAGFVHRWLEKKSTVLPYVNAVSGGLLMAMGVLLLAGLWDGLAALFY